MPTPAEKLFNETHGRTLRAWRIISIFRQTVHKGIDAAAQATLHETGSLYDQLLTSSQYEKLIIDREGFRKAVSKAQFVELAVKGSLETAINSLNAATILFAHSMVDGAAIDYCRVTVLHAPEDWEPDVLNKQVPLSVIRTASFEEIRKTKIDQALEELEMESLREKIDRLHARCKPPSGWSPMTGYAFDSKRIERLDRLRQDIVHGEALGQAIPNADEEFDYIFRTCMYFMGLVNLRYGLRLDPYSVMTYQPTS